MKDNLVMYGDRIYLRPITKQDAENIIRWRNSEKVRKYFIYQEPFTIENHEKWIEEMIESGNGYQFIICDIETDAPIGSTYLRDYHKEYQKIEYGIFVGEQNNRPKGIGTEALRLTVQFAFETLGVHKVTGRILENNVASLKISQKAGFQREALLKKDVLIEGSYRDVILVGQINPAHQPE